MGPLLAAAAYVSDDEAEQELVDERALEAREQCVQLALERLLNAVAQVVDAGVAARNVGVHAARDAVASMIATVEVAYVGREETETVAAGFWAPDEEPVPAPVDVWARGVLPTRRLVRSPALGAGEHTLDGSTIGGRQSKTQFTSTSRSAASVASDKGKSRSTPLPRGGDRPHRASIVTQTLVAKHSSKKELSPEEAEREQRLREEIDARRAAADLRREQVKKDEEELARLEALQKELRGKDYAYDHNGQVVVLNKLDPEKLPAQAVGMRVSVFETGEDPDALLEESSPKGRGAKKGKKPGKKSKAFLGDVGEDYIEATNDGQPSLMETMKMSTGVTLREAAGVKAGPRNVPDSLHMSRREFLALLSSQTGMIAPSPTLEPRGESAASGLAGGMTLADFGERTATPMQLEDWAADGVPIPPPLETVVTRPDPNEMLISAPDWGQNPPSKDCTPPTLLPKPLGTARELTVGVLPRYPRDRPFALPGGVGLRHTDPTLSPVSPSQRNTALPPLEASG